MKAQQEFLRRVVSFGLIISKLAQVRSKGPGKPPHLLPLISETATGAQG